MSGRRALAYRHTFTVSDPKSGWMGDVTVAYAVAWGRSAGLESPAEDAAVTGWEIVAVDREPVGREGPTARIEELTEARVEEIEEDLISAASEAEAYAAEQRQDARREALETTGVLW